MSISLANMHSDKSIHLFGSAGKLCVNFDDAYRNAVQQWVDESGTKVHLSTRVARESTDDLSLSWYARDGPLLDTDGKQLLEHVDLVIWCVAGVPNTKFLPSEWLDL